MLVYMLQNSANNLKAMDERDETVVTPLKTTKNYRDFLSERPSMVEILKQYKQLHCTISRHVMLTKPRMDTVVPGHPFDLIPAPADTMQMPEWQQTMH